MIDFDIENKFSPERNSVVRTKLIGVGGGGNNMINSMIDTGFDNVTFITANTDAQALRLSKAAHKVQLGIKSTKGLGAGSNPEIGRRSAEEDLDRILESVSDADIVFLAAGLGGGTGSGGLPVIAQALREKDILTIAVVTKPFTFEGLRRKKIADESLELLKREVDTLVVLPNQKLIEIVDKKVSLMEAFSLINNMLSQVVRSIVDIIDKPGHINVDFADIKTIMKRKGQAVIGTGRASGENRAYEAALQAISSPLLEHVDISGAQGILLNITGGPELGLHEMSTASSLVYEKAHEEAHIVLGSVIDESFSNDEVIVTVIATGFSKEEKELSNIKTQESEIPVTETKEESFNDKDEISDLTKSSVALNKNDNKQDELSIDLNDLDIPAVLRKAAWEKEVR